MKKNTILASVLLAGMTTAGALAYAADATTTTSNTTDAKPSFEMRGHRGGMERGSGQGSDRGGFMKLTDAEQTALKTMSDADKKTFFEKKRTEAEAARAAEQTKREAHEAVIDKLVNGETLTDAEKTTLAEIKTERAAAKAQRAEMQAKRDAVQKARTALQPILEKLKNKETLTADEQKQLYDAQSSGEGFGFGMGMGRGQGGRGFGPNADETPVSDAATTN